MSDLSTSGTSGGQPQLEGGGRWWQAWLLGGCMLLAFLPSLPGGFVYDDIALIAHNHFVQSWDFAGRAFSTHFWDVSNRTPQAHTLSYYRPLVTLSYLQNWEMGGGAPWAFHLLNLALHAASTWLSFRLARRWTGSQRLAWVCAAVFALHATRWEPVLWISGRPDPMMAFFLLASLEMAPRGAGVRQRAIWTVASFLSFCCALLSKEPAVAAPLLLLAGASTGGRRELRHQGALLGLCALGSASYLVARAAWLPVNAPGFQLTVTHGLETVAHYVERVLSPWPLTFFYKLPREDVPSGLGSLALGACALVLSLWMTIQAWRRDRPAFYLLLAAASFLGPLLHFTDTGSTSTTSDRFLYVPLWLLAVAACRFWRARLESVFQQRSVRLAAGGLLLIHTLLIFAKNADLLDRHALWNSEYSYNPQNPDALRSLSRLHSAEGETARGTELLEESLRNSSLVYSSVADPPSNALAYALLLHLKERDLPDGAFQTLRAVAQDGVDVLAGKPRDHRTDLFPIDWPQDRQAAALAAKESEEILARRLAPITSRLNQRELTVELLRAIPNQHLHLLDNPFLIVLAEAREERFPAALGRIHAMRDHLPMMPESVTEPALRELEQRVLQSRALFAQSRELQEFDARFARARGYAELGAYFRALMELRPLPQDYPGRAPLYLQLLVAARLEKKALMFGTPFLGKEATAEQIARIRVQLPPELRAQTVPGQSL